MLAIPPSPLLSRFLPRPGTAPQGDWERAIERMPGVLRFDKDTLAYLAHIMPRFTSADFYLTCPAYHAFTGRNGLWGYARGKSMVLFARNPADPSQILFFPQFGTPFPNLALEIMEKAPAPAGGYRFARYAAEQADFMAASMNKQSRRFRFHAETETILDWTYPVHTIATQEVIESAGRRFKSFRQHLNTIDESRIEISTLDPVRDMEALLAVITPWAEAKADICPPAEMIDVYVSFLKVMQNSALDLEGIKFHLDGELVAFEAWAMPAPGSPVANSFAGFSKTKIRGFSEFQHYTICRILRERGVEKICLGGSEVEGLDNFKRKMNPVHSVALKSIAVEERA